MIQRSSLLQNEGREKAGGGMWKNAKVGGYDGGARGGSGGSGIINLKIRMSSRLFPNELVHFIIVCQATCFLMEAPSRGGGLGEVGVDGGDEGGKREGKGGRWLEEGSYGGGREKSGDVEEEGKGEAIGRGKRTRGKDGNGERGEERNEKGERERRWKEDGRRRRRKYRRVREGTGGRRWKEKVGRRGGWT